MARATGSVNVGKIPAEAKSEGAVNAANDERSDPEKEAPVVESAIKDENDVFPPQSYRQDAVLVIHGKPHVFKQTVHHH